MDSECVFVLKDLLLHPNWHLWFINKKSLKSNSLSHEPNTILLRTCNTKKSVFWQVKMKIPIKKYDWCNNIGFKIQLIIENIICKDVACYCLRTNAFTRN